MGIYDAMWKSAMEDDEDEVVLQGNEVWYIIQVENSAETIRLLNQMGIPCNDVRKQYKENNIAFPSSSLDTVLACLGKQHHQILLEPTELKNTFILKFFNADTPYRLNLPKEQAESETINSFQTISCAGDGSSRDRFVEACSELYEKNLNEVEESIREYDTMINEYNRKIVESVKNRDLMRAKVEPLQSLVNSKKEWANNEYDTLLATPHIKGVMVVGKLIHVFTDLITITCQNHTYNLGEFRIDIHTDGDKSGVRAFNLTNSKNGILAHPHIKINGECCFGNIQDGVVKLLADYQYVVLTQLMISYLQSYNPNNAYGRIELWE